MSAAVFGPPTLHQWFRQVGWSADAINYPRSERSFLWLCKFNGCPPERAPPQWRYSPNAYMWAYTDQRAARDEAQRSEPAETDGKGAA